MLNELGPILIDAASRGAIVLVVALALTHALRRQSAAARHLIWVGAVVIQLLLPVFAIWGPTWDITVSNDVANVMPLELPQANTEPDIHVRSTPADLPSVAVSSSLPNLESSKPRFTRADILLSLWALGAVIVLARLAIGTVVVARLARKGNRVDDGNWLSLAQKLSMNLGIDRPLTLLRGDRLGVPVTWGIVYPVVLLPEDADTWPDERRRFVLVHEMAHVKRLDALTQLAGQFALALFWFNPLVWIANRRMQLEREHACDDYVIRHGTMPSLYAEELLTMVRSIGTPNHRSSQPAFAALAMARRSEFEGRMLSILDPVLDRHPLSKGRALISALAALLLVVPLAALHPYRAAPTRLSLKTVAPAEVQKQHDLPESFKVSIVAPESSASGVERLSVQPVTQTPPSPNATTDAKAPTCDAVQASSSGATSTHIHAHDGDGTSLFTYLSYNTSKCASATIAGLMKFSPNEDDIVELPHGSHAEFRERQAGTDRELSVTYANNAIAHAYRENGEPASYDGSARAWFAGFLPKVLTETGMNVDARVVRWRAQGGLDNALAHISTLTSSGARRSHYEALIDSGRLSSADLDKVISSAAQSLRSSSGDMRAILARVPAGQLFSKQNVSAVERAIMSLASSGDKSTILLQYGQTDDRDMLLGVMRVAETIASSGDRSRLLQVLVSRYLTKNDRGLEDAFFDCAEKLPSSGDLRNTLMVAMPYSNSSATITRRLIKSIKAISSSGDQAATLIALANSGSLVTRELRDAFLNAVEAIPSDGDRARVLKAALSMRQ